VDNARLTSAVGRMVSVGLRLAFASVVGVMDARKRGHSIMVFASVLRRKGRYVSLANVALSGTDGGDDAGWSAEGLTICDARACAGVDDGGR